jgi:DNA-binding transcriptional LysR family regulator
VGRGEAGQRFLAYALSIVRLWLQGRQEMAFAGRSAARIGAGIHISLRKRLALRWLTAMRARENRPRIHLELDCSGKLVDLVAQGILDFAVV